MMTADGASLFPLTAGILARDCTHRHAHLRAAARSATRKAEEAKIPDRL
jgi:hypothetical protein